MRLSSPSRSLQRLGGFRHGKQGNFQPVHDGRIGSCAVHQAVLARFLAQEKRRRVTEGKVVQAGHGAFVADAAYPMLSSAAIRLSDVH